MSEDTLNLENPEAKAQWEIAQQLFSAGQIDEALISVEHCLNTLNQLGEPGHADSVLVGDRVTSLLSAMGREQQALPFRELVLSIERRTLPADHPNIAISMNGLAVSYAALGRRDEALKLNEETLAFRKRVLSPNHPYIADSMNNLAVSYANLGRRDEALKLNEETLAFRKRVLPSDHPDIALSMNNLAISYSDLGRRDEALKLREETLVFRKRILPPDHPNIATSMNNLARSYANLGRRDEALKLREETLIFSRSILPPNHPDIAISMNNLADSYADLGRHDEALKLREETLAFRRRVLPPDHPDIAAAMNNLAISYSDLGRHDEALKLQAETLTLHKCILPLDHPDIASAMNNLAKYYDALGRHNEALKLREEMLAFRKRVLPPDHPDIAAAMNNLAVSYSDLGWHDEALKLREETLAFRKRVLPPDHPDIANSMYNLAISYAALGRQDEALALRQERMRVQIAHYLNGSPFMPAPQRTARLADLSTDLTKLVPVLTTLGFPQDRIREQALLHLSLKGLDVLATTLRPTLFAHATSDFRARLEQLFSWQAQAARLWNTTDSVELDWLRQLMSQIQELEAQLMRDPRGTLLAETLGLQVLSLESVCTALSKREALISYDVLGETLVATVVRQDGHTAIHVLNTLLARLKEDVERIRSQLIVYSSPDPDDLGDLYDALISPLEADLQLGSQTTSLVISGDTFLYTLPWGLLTRTQDEPDTLLMELVQLRLIPTPRDLVRLSQRSDLERPATSASLLVGISRFGAVSVDGQELPAPFPSPAVVLSLLPPPDSATGAESDSSDPKRGPTTRRGVHLNRGAGGLTQDYLDLNHVEPEVRAVGQILQHLADEGRMSSPRLLLPPHPLTADVVFAAIDSPEILHLSTHSDVWNIEDARRWYAPLTETVRYSIDAATSDPEHPFSRAVVLFEGANRLLQEGSLSGILRAWEIATLKLRGTGLVVFSSCNSGLIESSAGYGLAGLAMAAFLAGAQRTLSTLWSVNDHGSAVFIVEVYRRWLQGEANQTLQGALTETQRTCMRGGTLPGQAGEQVKVPIDVWAAFILNGLA